MEELIVQYGGALGISIYLVVSWWRSRNEAREGRIREVSTLSAALNAALASLNTTRERLDVIDRERVDERERAALERIKLQNTIDELRDEQRELQRQTRDQADAIKRLTLQNEQLNTRVQSLEAENAQLRKERDEARADRDSWKLTSDKQQAEIDELKAKVAKLEKHDTGPLPELKPDECVESDQEKTDDGKPIQ